MCSVFNSQLLREKAAFTTRIDDEASPQFVGHVFNVLVFQGHVEIVPHAGRFDLANIALLETNRPRRASFLKQEPIDVLPQPVRVRVLIAAAGRDEQLGRMHRIRHERPTGLVMKVRESAFDPGDQLRMRRLPGAVLRQRSNSRRQLALAGRRIVRSVSASVLS